MGKKLSHMTWADVQAEMSIAGSPEKIAKLGNDVMDLVESKIDITNRAELTNVEFMLQRVLAEVKRWQRMYDNSHKLTQK